MRNHREANFDLNRRLEENNMENQQDIENLRQIIDQNQRELEALRQQLARPNEALMFQLTADQVINKFQRIKTFTGKGDYCLQEFIHAVENVATLCGNNLPLLQHGLRVVFKEKVQGEAKMCIQRLGENATWDQVKAELKTEFRPRKSYKKLFDECRNIKVTNLRDLLNIIRSINYKLNELYEFDDNKPANYSPDNNDKNLVDIIKDMLTGSYRTNIRNNMTINDVFNVFDNLGLLEESDVIHYSYRKTRDARHNNVHRKDFKRNDRDRQANNFSSNNNYNKNFGNRNNNFENNSGNSKRDRSYFNNNNNSGQYKQNDNFFQRHYNNGRNQSGQLKQGHNNNNNTAPMEIDNIQHENDVNFSNEPRTDNCQ